jgi:hypothetical protein
MNVNDLLSSDEVPADVQALIEQFELASGEVRQVSERKFTAIRTKADQKIREINDRAEQEVAELQQRGEEEIRALVQDLFRKIKPLQEGYLRAGKLDEALAIRDRVRQLRACLFEVRADPGYLHGNPEDLGKTFLYEVTGSTDGYIYGTDVYSTDSTLATAAVHAGVLKAGEKGLVRVTFLKDKHPSFEATTRHGITSYSWSSAYPGFRVGKV